jgi:hypothetical protein
MMNDEQFTLHEDFVLIEEINGLPNCEAIAAPLKIIRSITRDKAIT